MLQDILGLSVGQTRQELFPERSNKLGTSLFEAVTNRSCQEAGVPLLYCSCDMDQQNLQPDDPLIVSIANGVLADINQYLRSDYSSLIDNLNIASSGLEFCQTLTLATINHATMRVALPSFQLYAVEGEAKFQVDIVCDENNSCSVKLSRLDWYEATSQCIPTNLKERIKELCICSQ